MCTDTRHTSLHTGSRFIIDLWSHLSAYDVPVALMSQLAPALTPPIFQPAARVTSFGATVFAEFTALALETGAINLGQGFPNFPAPDFIKEAARKAIANDLNQYTRSGGHGRLVEALSAFYGPLLGRDLDPMTEVVTTVGATEGIFATIQAVVNPGDEVIMFEPFYDSYPACTIMAGGTPVYVPFTIPASQDDVALSAADWTVDMERLADAFTPRTRMIIINTPHNPVGKVFSRAELQAIADLVQDHSSTHQPVYVLSDEAYEWMTYDGCAHNRMATLPGMWEHTITLGSSGKTFSVTGWKIGWAFAPPEIVHAILMAHQWIPFTIATPFQEAVAEALQVAQEQNYFNQLSTMYQAKRDKLLAYLQAAGLRSYVPHGSYFILSDTHHLDVPTRADEPRDVTVCRWLTSEIGVVAIPPSAFYSTDHRHLVADLARFTFCKTDEMLDEAGTRFQALRI